MSSKTRKLISKAYMKPLNRVSFGVLYYIFLPHKELKYLSSNIVRALALDFRG